jgi:hypothetical protein
MRTPLQQSIKSNQSGMVESNLHRKRRMLDCMLNQHEEETKSAQSSFAENKVTVMEEVDDWKLR